MISRIACGAVRRAPSRKLVSSENRRALNLVRRLQVSQNHYSSSTKRFRTTPTTDFYNSVANANSFREAEKLLLAETERQNGLTNVDQMAILLMCSKASQPSDLLSHGNSFVSALSSVSVLNGVLLGRIFTPQPWWNVQTQHVIVSLAHVMAKRLSLGDPESPNIRPEVFDSILQFLNSAAASQKRLHDSKNVKTAREAESAHKILLDYIVNLRPDVPRAIVHRARSVKEIVIVQDTLKLKGHAKSSKPMHAIRDMARKIPTSVEAYWFNDRLRDLCVSALQTGKGSELIELAFETLPSSKYLGIIPSVCAALAVTQDISTLLGILRQLPVDYTFDPMLLILVTQLSHSIQSPALAEICVAVFYRVWEKLSETPAVHPEMIPFFTGALERMLVVSFRSADANLARTVIRAASFFNLNLNPRSINNLLFLFLDHGLASYAMAILETAAGIMPPVDLGSVSDPTLTQDALASARLFNIDSQLSPINMNVYSHFAVSIARLGLWTLTDRFVALLRSRPLTLSDAFCKSAFTDARIAGATPENRLLLAQFFLDFPDVFLLLSGSIKLFIQEAGTSGRPDKCLAWTEQLLQRFGTEYADPELLRVVLKSFAKSGNDHLALQVLLIFKQYGISIDLSLYTVILRMYQDRLDVKSYFAVINGMIAANITPPQSALTAGAELCITVRTPLIVQALLLLEQFNIPPKQWRWRTAKEILKEHQDDKTAKELIGFVNKKIRSFDNSSSSHEPMKIESSVNI